MMHPPRGRRERRGTALVAATLVLSVLAALALAMFTTSTSAAREQIGAREETHARYVAEAGIHDAVFALRQGGDGELGSADQPVGFGGASYWVESTDLGDGLTSLVATGLEGRAGSRLELVVQRTSNSLWRWGAFGDDFMTMDSNAHVDSYDSSLGTYASQEVNGSGNSTYANANGHVGSNGSIGLRQNASIHGNAQPGPGEAVTALGNSTVSGTTVALAEELELPPLEVPNLPTVSGLLLALGGFLPSGDHGFTDTVLGTGRELRVAGPATLLFESLELRSNSSLIVDASAGPVEIFVLDDFVMNSNTQIRSTDYDPADLALNLLSDNVINPELEVDLDDVDFESNAMLFGTIYAPNASIEINSNFELFGALVARRVHLDSNSQIHFDENLTQIEDDSSASWETVMWRVLPYRPGDAGAAGAAAGG